MMIVKNYVAASAIHGVGLFAAEDIAEGQVVYVYTLGVDIAMTREELVKFGPEFTRFMIIYAYEDMTTHDMVISIDNSRFMNHAADPNTAWDAQNGWATRPIAKDEEITCDYHVFWYKAPFADPRL